MPFPSSAVPPGFDVSVWAEGVQSGREPVLRSLFVDANATAGDVLVLAKEWDDDVGDGWGDDDVGDHRRCSSSRAVAAVAARVAAIAFACCLVATLALAEAAVRRERAARREEWGFGDETRREISTLSVAKPGISAASDAAPAVTPEPPPRADPTASSGCPWSVRRHARRPHAWCAALALSLGAAAAAAATTAVLGGEARRGAACAGDDGDAAATTTTTTAAILALWDDDGDGVSGAHERAVLIKWPGLTHGLAARDG